MKLAKNVQIQATNLNELARRYQTIKDEIEALEEMLKPYRNSLEDAAKGSNGILVLEDFKVTVTPASREVFSLKEARLTLGEVLKPFIRVSRYSQLKVTERKAA